MPIPCSTPTFGTAAAARGTSISGRLQGGKLAGKSTSAQTRTKQDQQGQKPPGAVHMVQAESQSTFQVKKPSKAGSSG